MESNPNEIKPIKFKIYDSLFEAIVIPTVKGSFWWSFCNNNGETSGREIEPLSFELPTEIDIEGTKYEFREVVLKNSDGTINTKPFHKTRRVITESDLQGFCVSIQCRVTLKKNTKWHLSFSGTIKKGKGSPASSPNNIIIEKDSEEEIQIIDLDISNS